MFRIFSFARSAPSKPEREQVTHLLAIRQVIDVDADGSQLTGDADDSQPTDDADGSQPRSGNLPYGFWKDFFKDKLHAHHSKAKSLQASRAWQLFIRVREEGCQTREAMRGDRPRGSMRASGGSINAQRARGLGFMLLQFFVDQVQKFSCRADTTLLMTHARILREQLEQARWPASDLPKLVGNAGHKWMARWRKQYNIVKNKTGMKLKVA